MAGIDYRYRNNGTFQADQVEAKKPAMAASMTLQWWFRLLAVLFIAEFIVPFILWQAGLPRSLDGFKELAAGLVVAVLFAYMMLRDRIPAAFLFILAVTLIWGLVSLLDGQGITATFWGWWRLLKYPLVGVFAFLVPRWPPDSGRRLVKFLVLLLAFEVGVQALQFATGQPPGDSLAGTFGWKGVAQHTMLVFFVVSIGFGHWMATGEWKLLGFVLVLGLVGTMLSVTKFYLVGAAILGIVALVIHLVRGGKFRHLLVYILLAAVAAASFVPIYNNFIATTRGLKPLQEYLTVESINDYLFKGDETTESGVVKMGRGMAIVYAWQQIQRDYTTVFCGYGIGGRTSSTALGVSGSALQDDPTAGSGGSGLSIWIQEYGVVGTALFLLLNTWIMWKLFRHARATSDPYQATLAYGMMLFTLLWPLWLWYKRPWAAGGMMMMYWITLGYLFQQIYGPRLRLRARRRGISREPVPVGRQIDNGLDPGQ